MKNRLEVAKELLEDGVIFVQCDDNEYRKHLKVLLDGVFWK
jgi:adenine specific DNA methylase Mod